MISISLVPLVFVLFVGGVMFLILVCLFCLVGCIFFCLVVFLVIVSFVLFRLFPVAFSTFQEGSRQRSTMAELLQNRGTQPPNRSGKRFQTLESLQNEQRYIAWVPCEGKIVFSLCTPAVVTHGSQQQR